MRELVILRNAMVPHIYTLAWIAHRSAISVVRPMYYAFPEAEEAYRFKGQYMFGPDTLVAPIVSAVTKPNGTAAKDIWLPPSPAPWLSWDGRAAFRGASVRTLCFGLADLPVFVRAGTVMPTRTAASSRAATADPLVWVVWLGGDGAQTEGSGTLYEDAGDGFAHLSAAHLSAAPEAAEPEGSALTRALLRASGAEATVRLLGTRGSYPGQPPSREVVLQLRGGPQGRSAAVRVDGRPVPAGGARGSLVDPPGAFTVSLGRRGIRQDTVVHIAWPASEPPAPLRYV
ncbi:unnamed protein product [Prorocentrum cordatum]|uniref:DUF5110 domain-containing protein n=1 Tax=Prorocentrum cordatum TaxID=2364126 RepID=A0ABN9PJW8_9DINO|nr:unnamed protein product [Polarella glacialis]